MEICIGEVTHFYSRIYVAVLKLSGEINTGDQVHILGHTTDFVQRVRSMEIDHRPVQTVAAGKEVALKVMQLVRRGDIVFKVSGAEAEQSALEGTTFIKTSS
jgi:translation elongation factor EF-1alpha